ncbi:MAG TPA: hypothetical protein VGN63_00010 [Flavisolibacter sp.]|jgi:hypothetical protein|nr:hypothetical protein [Flavisolibacter sp.]
MKHTGADYKTSVVRARKCLSQRKAGGCSFFIEPIDAGSALKDVTTHRSRSVKNKKRKQIAALALND